MMWRPVRHFYRWQERLEKLSLHLPVTIRHKLWEEWEDIGPSWVRLWYYLIVPALAVCLALACGASGLFLPLVLKEYAPITLLPSRLGGVMWLVSGLMIFLLWGGIVAGLWLGLVRWQGVGRANLSLVLWLILLPQGGRFLGDWMDLASTSLSLFNPLAPPPSQRLFPALWELGGIIFALYAAWLAAVLRLSPLSWGISALGIGLLFSLSPLLGVILGAFILGAWLLAGRWLAVSLGAIIAATLIAGALCWWGFGYKSAALSPGLFPDMAFGLSKIGTLLESFKRLLHQGLEAQMWQAWLGVVLFGPAEPLYSPPPFSASVGGPLSAYGLLYPLALAALLAGLFNKWRQNLLLVCFGLAASFLLVQAPTASALIPLSQSDAPPLRPFLSIFAFFVAITASQSLWWIARRAQRLGEALFVPFIVLYLWLQPGLLPLELARRLVNSLLALLA
jgi:hypothetical protein